MDIKEKRKDKQEIKLSKVQIIVQKRTYEQSIPEIKLSLLGIKTCCEGG